MHIPDNYLSPSTCAVMGTIMIPLWRRAIKNIKKEISKKRMPLLGIGAAFSFLIMMFNIPLPGGTTGHAVGATLVAILLGPDAACISVTIALLLQALLFGDGGILSFGANSFNMAFIMSYTGYYIYKFLRDRFKARKGELISIFFAAYVAINISALFAAIEFGLQPLLFKDANGMPLYSPYPLYISIPAMLLPHLLVAGVLEGLITVGVYKFIKNASPGMIYENESIKMKPIVSIIIGLIILSPIGLLATGTAWGEWSSSEIKAVSIGGRTLGYVPKGIKEGFDLGGFMPHYSIKGIPAVMGYIMSACAGAAILMIVFKLIAGGKGKNQVE